MDANNNIAFMSAPLTKAPSKAKTELLDFEKKVEISRKNNILADQLLNVLQRPPSAVFRAPNEPGGPTSLNRLIRQQEYEKTKANNDFMMKTIVRTASHYRFEPSVIQKPAQRSSLFESTPRNLDFLVNLTVRAGPSPSRPASRPASSKSSLRQSKRVQDTSKPFTLFRNTVELPLTNSDQTKIPARVIVRERLDRSFEIEVSGEGLSICQTFMSYSDLRAFFPTARQTSGLVSGVLSCLALSLPSETQLAAGADPDLYCPIFVPPSVAFQTAVDEQQPVKNAHFDMPYIDSEPVKARTALGERPQPSRPQSTASRPLTAAKRPQSAALNRPKTAGRVSTPIDVDQSENLSAAVRTEAEPVDANSRPASSSAAVLDSEINHPVDAAAHAQPDKDPFEPDPADDYAAEYSDAEFSSEVQAQPASNTRPLVPPLQLGLVQN